MNKKVKSRKKNKVNNKEVNKEIVIVIEVVGHHTPKTVIFVPMFIVLVDFSYML